MLNYKRFSQLKGAGCNSNCRMIDFSFRFAPFEMTAGCEKGDGGKLRLRRSFPPSALSIMRGVISRRPSKKSNSS